MGEIFLVYLLNSIQLSVIILVMLAISKILSRRYSAKCRYYLWTIVFVALLLPIRAKMKLSLPNFLQADMLHNTVQKVSHSTVVNTAANWDWLHFIELLWIAGTAVFLVWHIFSHLRFLSAVKRWSEEVKEEVILKSFYSILTELGIKKQVSIKSCACIKTPMVVGLLHPVVLLPHVHFCQDELPLILKHELVHMKRKDLWYKVLMMSALSIHWFNPFIHLAVKSVLNLCEISCDEQVLKGIDAKGRVRYGESVIGIIRNSGNYKTVLSTNFYNGTKGMKQRIYAMMDITAKRFSPVLFLVVLFITMCGTTAFVLSPVKSAVSANNIEQQPNQTLHKNTVPDNVDNTVPPRTSDMEQKDTVNQSSDGESVPPPRLIQTDEVVSMEGSEELPYEFKIYRLVPDDEK